MAAYKLYDTVNDGWISFDTEKELNDKFNSSENSRVQTKNYGVTKRYTTEKPSLINDSEDKLIVAKKSLSSAWNGVQGLVEDGKDIRGKKLHLTDGRVIDKEAAKNAPIFYSTKNREFLIFDHNSGEYIPQSQIKEGSDLWNANFNDIADLSSQNSGAREQMWKSSIDKDEDSFSWLSHYKDLDKEGIKSFSEKELQNYTDSYQKGNAAALSKDASFNPNDIDIIKRRMLYKVGGDNALYNYLKEFDVPKDDPLWNYAGLSNKELVDYSNTYPQFKDVYNQVMDLYMQKYYSGVLEQYKDIPKTISEDIQGQMNDEFKAINDRKNEEIAKNGKWYNRFYREADALVDMAGTWLSQTLFNKIPNTWFWQDSDIHNEQRDRANAVLDQISSEFTQGAFNNLQALKYDNPTEYEKQKQALINDEDGFDALAQSVFPQYKDRKKTLEEDGLTDEEKMKLMLQYQEESAILNPRVANERFTQRITDMAADSQGWLAQFGDADMNFVNTIAGTTAQIASFTWNYRPTAYVKDAINAGIEAAENGTSYSDELHKQIQDRWDYALNNFVMEWGENVQNTGEWSTAKQQERKADGTQAFHIYKKYGHENDFSFAEALPVMGMGVSTKAASAGLNLVSQGFKGLAVVAESAKAARAWKAIGAISKPLAWTAKPLRWSGKFIDTTAPAWATAGLDFGYAKSSYDSKMTDAYGFVGKKFEGGIDEDKDYTANLDIANADSKFVNRLTSDVAIGRWLDEQDIDVKLYGGKTEAIKYYRNLIEEGLGKTELSDGESPFVSQAILDSIYKSEAKAYLNEAHDNALLSSAFTFGTTVIPDCHIATTWRKSMFSATSQNAIAEFKAKARQRLHMKPGKIDMHIKGVSKGADGVWHAESDLVGDSRWAKLKFTATPYINAAKGGFLSNYLQDIGVGFGNGNYEERMNEYIDQRFSSEAADQISYNFDNVLYQSCVSATQAFGDWTSFRDGLYGGLTSFFYTGANLAKMKNDIKKADGKGKRAKVHAVLNNAGLPLWNMTLGASDIVAEENENRKKGIEEVNKWLKNNGEAYLSGAGQMLNLSRTERQAIQNGDWSKLSETRRGQIVQDALMMNLLQDKSAAVANMVEYMKQRVDRGKVTKKEVESLMEVVKQVNTLNAEGKAEEAEALMNKQSARDQSILKDLMTIDTYRKENTTGRDNRTNTKMLNDLVDNAQEFMDTYNNVQKYLAEAQASYPQGDPVVLQEYAKMRAHNDIVKRAVKNADEKISKLLSFNYKESTSDKTPSVRPASLHAAVVIATSKADISALEVEKDKLEQEHKKTAEAISQLKNQLRILKMGSKLSRFSESDLKQLNQLNTLLKVWQSLDEENKTRQKEIYDTLKEVKESDASNSEVFLSLNDIKSLSQEDMLAMITSKNLTEKQAAEVKKFLDTVEEMAKDEDVKDEDLESLLTTSISGKKESKQLAIEEGMDSEAYRRLEQRVSDAKVKQAISFFKAGEKPLVENIKKIDNYRDFVTAVTQEMSRIRESKKGDPKELVDMCIDAFGEMLKDSKFYDKFSKNFQRINDVTKGIKKYLTKEVYSKEEQQEIEDSIRYATLRGIEGDNLLAKLTEQDNDFFEDLREYLQSTTTQPVGTAEDLKNRILTYYDRYKTVEKNKQEEAQRKAPQASKEAAKTSSVNEAIRVTAFINAVKDYLSKETGDHKAITEMLQNYFSIGFSGPVFNTYFNDDTLNVVKDIIEKLPNDNSLTTEQDLIDKVNELFNEKINSLDINKDGDVIAALGTVKDVMLNKISSISKTGVQGPTVIVNQTLAPAAPAAVTAPAKSIIKRGSFNFVDLTKLTNETLKEAVKEAQRFLGNHSVNKDSRMVFIVNNQENGWTDSTKKSLGESYKAEMHLPIIGAVEVSLSEVEKYGYATAIKIGDKYYMPLGVLPSSSNNLNNVSVIRTNAQRIADGQLALVTDNTDQNNGPLSTQFSVDNHFQIDVDAEPTMVESIGSEKTRTQNDVRVEEDADGKKTVKIKSHRGDNSTQGNNADWAVVEVQEVDKTTNAEGKTIAEVEDASKFNSRTERFVTTVNNIVKELSLKFKAAGPNNIGKVLTELSRDFNPDDKGKDTSSILINSKLENSDIEKQLGLSAFMSLQNDYKWEIRRSDNKPSADIFLCITKDGTLVEGSEIVLGKAGAIFNGNTTIKTSDSDMIKTLAALVDSEGNPIVKWQVSYGNFNLENQKGVDHKNAYINKALSDRILYSKPVLMTSQIEMEPIMTKEDQKQQQENNEKREAAVLERIGLDKTDGTVGMTIADAIKALKTGKLSALIEENKKILLKALTVLSINAQRANVELKNGKGYDINQTKPRKRSGTSVTDVANDNDTNNAAEEIDEQSAVRLIIGNCVDRAVRDYFTPGNTVTSQTLYETFKGLLSQTSCDNLLLSLQKLENSFKEKGWTIIPSNVFVYNKDIDTRTGEIDLLCIDGQGMLHVVDIKTFSGEFHDGFKSPGGYSRQLSDGGYSRQLSEYRYYILNNCEISPAIFPEENLHICGLQVDTSLDLTRATRDKDGTWTASRNTKNLKPVISKPTETRGGFQWFDHTNSDIHWVDNIEQIIQDRIAKAKGKKTENTAAGESPIKNMNSTNTFVQSLASRPNLSDIPESTSNTKLIKYEDSEGNIFLVPVQHYVSSDGKNHYMTNGFRIKPSCMLEESLGSVAKYEYENGLLDGYVTITGFVIKKEDGSVHTLSNYPEINEETGEVQINNPERCYKIASTVLVNVTPESILSFKEVQQLMLQNIDTLEKYLDKIDLDKTLKEEALKFAKGDYNNGNVSAYYTALELCKKKMAEEQNMPKEPEKKAPAPYKPISLSQFSSISSDEDIARMC